LRSCQHNSISVFAYPTLSTAAPAPITMLTFTGLCLHGRALTYHGALFSAASGDVHHLRTAHAAGKTRAAFLPHCSAPHAGTFIFWFCGILAFLPFLRARHILGGRTYSASRLSPPQTPGAERTLAACAATTYWTLRRTDALICLWLLTHRDARLPQWVCLFKPGQTRTFGQTFGLQFGCQSLLLLCVDRRSCSVPSQLSLGIAQTLFLFTWVTHLPPLPAYATSPTNTISARLTGRCWTAPQALFSSPDARTVTLRACRRRRLAVDGDVVSGRSTPPPPAHHRHHTTCHHHPAFCRATTLRCRLPATPCPPPHLGYPPYLP